MSENNGIVKKKQPIYHYGWFWVIALLVTLFFIIETYHPQLEVQNPIDAEYLGCHIQYLRHEVHGDRKPELLIYYQFNNHSDKDYTHTFDSVVDQEAYQDLIKLNSTSNYSTEGKNTRAVIKPGASITVCTAFYLRNKTSDVEVTMKEDALFFGEELGTMTLKLK